MNSGDGGGRLGLRPANPLGGTLLSYLYSAHIGYLFTELPFAERIRAAATLGFAAVEFPSPYGIPARQMAQWLGEVGVRYTQFGVYAGDAGKGEKGIAMFPERRAEFHESVAAALDYAEIIGTRMLHVMSGILKAEDRKPHHRQCYIDNLAFAARQAAERGMDIIVEPMSAAAVPDYFVETPATAASIISETGQSNIGLLLDVFHTASIGQHIAETIESLGMQILHVHLADFPGRHEPGTGNIDFLAIERALEKVGYRGLLGCEYTPSIDTETSLRWFVAQNEIANFVPIVGA